MLPPGEKIIETKKCRVSGHEFYVTDRDLEFYDKVSPIFWGKKYSIPSPTLCPEERKRKRMMMRNDRSLYYSSVEWKLSVYSSEWWYTSFQPPKFWSDGWSPMDYGIAFNFGENVFSQFNALNIKVPKLARSILNEENSDFVNQAWMIKDCYLVFGGNYGENLYYGNRFLRSKNCIDFLWIFGCEYCYEVTDCVNCFWLFYSQECTDCRDSQFLYACSNCEYCFWCINLVSRKYCFFNEQLDESEYQKRIRDFSFSQHLVPTKKKIQRFFLEHFFRENTNDKSENCIDNKTINSQNVFDSYLIIDGKDMKYCDELFGPMDNNYDVYTFGNGVHFSYECSVVGHNVNHCLFCHDSWENISDLLYCMYCCKWVTNCFLSTGLKKENHCIMNMAYSVQEYETLCWKIIDHMRSTGEWWEFFDSNISPFGYNETVAQEYYPLTEKEVYERGLKWHHEAPKMKPWNTVRPLMIDQYDETKVGYEVAQKNIDSLLDWIILCTVTWRPFKIIKQELVFYIEHSLPIPTKHPDQRHKERMTLRNPRTLYERTCAECQKEIITTYSPERPEKVVCEKCYRKLVY